MKKYITLAALLAAGTAFATPGTPATIDTEATASDALFATSFLSYEALQLIIGTANTNRALLGVQWKQDETTTYNSSISVGSWSGSSELHIYNLVAGSSISGNAAASFSDSTNWPQGHNVRSLWNADSVLQGAITLGYSGANVANQSVSGISVALSVYYKDGTLQTIYGNCAGQKYSSLAPSVLTYDSSLLSTPEITVGNWTKESLIKVTEASAIPEPSAFGLLAGIGALALVASRRRRK